MKLYPFLLFLSCWTGKIYSQQAEPVKAALNTTAKLVVYQYKDTLSFRDLLTNQVLYEVLLPSNKPLDVLAFDPSGTQLILSGRQRSTSVYRVGRNAAQKIAELPLRTVSVAFSHSGKKAYLLYAKNALKSRLAVYDAQTWKKLAQKLLPAVSGDIMINANDSLISYSSVGTIKTIDAGSLKLDKVLWERTAQRLIVFNPVLPGECASATRTNSIQIRDLQNDSILMEIVRHNATIQTLSYRPDGRLLFSLDKKGDLCVWSLSEKTLVAELKNVHGLPFWDSMGSLQVVAHTDNSRGRTNVPPDTSGDRSSFHAYKEPPLEVFFSPSFGYAPETGFTLGLGLTELVKPVNNSRYYRPSVYTASASYGFTGNQVLTALSVNSYISDKWNLSANMDYDAHSRNFYFGIGRGAGRGNKKPYFSNNFSFSGSLYRMIGQQVGAGVGYDIRHNTRAEFEQTIGSFPLGVNGGMLIGIGPIFRLDSRDNILSPARGRLLDIAFLRYGLAGDYQYNEVKLDYRKYLPIGDPVGGRLIAIQGMADLTWGGDAPFYSLPYFTADRAFRGIYRNLYIDRQVMSLQAEFRSLFTRADPRFGYAIFAGGADGTSDFFNGYKPDIKAVYGLGLRQQLHPKNSLLLRVDLAWTSKGDFGIFAGLGTSF